jgi:hypothetical protein
MRRALRLAMRLVLLALASLGAAAIVSRALAPFPWSPQELTPLHEAVLQHQLRADSTNEGVVFVSTDGHDPVPGLLERLSPVNTKVSLRPKSQAPAVSCQVAAGYVPVGPCQGFESLASVQVSMPLWRTAIVHASTRACFTEHVAINAFGAWRVVSSSTACT